MAAGVNRQDDEGPCHVGVAVSGGLDSTALLHCVVALARRHPALRVHALHVNHGLQDDADAWQRRVAEQCHRWSRPQAPLSFHAARLQGRPGRGESVEAWARQHRYEALARLARQQGCDIVLLAQHLDDQAETVLLQALRGAGPAGLAGMAACRLREGILWVRPWLAQPRSAIEAYARRHRLGFVDDPSNASTRFARNRLRHEVLPALRESFPDAVTALAAVARRAAEAAEVLAAMAAHDAGHCLDGATLCMQPWLALDDARRRNLLRHWLSDRLPEGAPETLVGRLARELPRLRAGRWPAGAGTLQLSRGRLTWVAALAASEHEPVASTVVVDLRRPGLHRVPGWPGQMLVERVSEGGITTAWLQQAQVRPRLGAEQFQRAPRSTPRSLKKQFQAQEVPAWMRDGPLVWRAEQLLFVAGLGLDARCLAAPGDDQRRLRWLPAGEGGEGEASGSAG